MPAAIARTGVLLALTAWGGCASTDVMRLFAGGNLNSDQYSMAQRGGNPFEMQSTTAPWDSRNPSGALASGETGLR